MKLKSILGTFVALGAMALMAVGVQAATYSVGTVSDATAGTTVTLPVTVTPDTDETVNLNAYAISFTYNPDLATPVVYGTDALDQDCYASAGDSFSTSDSSIMVADIIEGTDTNTLVVAWASADAVSVSEAATLANVQFAVAEDAAEDNVLTVKTATVATDTDGEVTSYTAETASGAINLASTYLFGDVNGNGTVTGADSAILFQYTSEIMTLDELEALYPGAYDRSDINGNGSVTGADSAILFQYTSELLTYEEFNAYNQG